MAKTKTVNKEKEKKNSVHIEGKDITKEEFTRYVRPCGSSAHVGLSKHWVNKYVHVVIEEVKE